jgi:hypothetical protein
MAASLTDLWTGAGPVTAPPGRQLQALFFTAVPCAVSLHSRRSLGAVLPDRYGPAGIASPTSGRRCGPDPATAVRWDALTAGLLAGGCYGVERLS